MTGDLDLVSFTAEDSVVIVMWLKTKIWQSVISFKSEDYLY